MLLSSAKTKKQWPLIMASLLCFIFLISLNSVHAPDKIQEVDSDNITSLSYVKPNAIAGEKSNIRVTIDPELTSPHANGHVRTVTIQNLGDKTITPSFGFFYNNYPTSYTILEREMRNVTVKTPQTVNYTVLIPGNGTVAEHTEIRYKTT